MQPILLTRQRRTSQKPHRHHHLLLLLLLLLLHSNTSSTLLTAIQKKFAICSLTWPRNWTDPSVPLSTASEWWIAERTDVLHQELERFVVSRCANQEQQHDLACFNKFITRWFEELVCIPPPPPTSFTDVGLIYQLDDPARSWRSTSRPAYRILLRYYIEYVGANFTMPASTVI